MGCNKRVAWWCRDDDHTLKGLLVPDLGGVVVHFQVDFCLPIPSRRVTSSRLIRSLAVEDRFHGTPDARTGDE